MSYRLVNANDLAEKYPEVNDMNCIYADLPNGLDNHHYKIETDAKEKIISMLTDIQLEIEKKFNDRPFSYNHHQRTEFYRDSNEIIQQKINAIEGKINNE